MALTVDEAVARLERLAFLRRQAALEVLTTRIVQARQLAVAKYMLPRAPASVPAQPGKLTHRSGSLGRSTKVLSPRFVGENLIAGLRTGGPTAPYGPIHERGGKTGAHDIRPLRRRWLRWMGPDGPRFAKLVHHPGSRFPARPRLRPSLEDTRRLVLADLRQRNQRIERELFG